MLNHLIHQPKRIEDIAHCLFELALQRVGFAKTSQIEVQ